MNNQSRRPRTERLLERHGVKGLLERINRFNPGTLMETLGICYCDVGRDFLEASMPVGPAVHQPMGLLHGGATAVLAESVGSAASALHLEPSTHYAVGLELSVNHLKSAREGTAIARAEPLHLGRSTHLWDIGVRDGNDRRIAVARLTMMVLPR